MIELTEKYVLHIPLSKCIDDMLVDIDIDDILEDLISQLNLKGFDGFYITRVESHYKSLVFDEVVITIFSSQNKPIEIFRDWFIKNNNFLGQEAFAYEHNNKMIIEKLMF